MADQLGYLVQLLFVIGAIALFGTGFAVMLMHPGLEGKLPGLLWMIGAGAVFLLGRVIGTPVAKK